MYEYYQLRSQAHFSGNVIQLRSADLYDGISQAKIEIDGKKTKLNDLLLK